MNWHGIAAAYIKCMTRMAIILLMAFLGSCAESRPGYPYMTPTDDAGATRIEPWVVFCRDRAYCAVAPEGSAILVTVDLWGTFVGLRGRPPLPPSAHLW